MRKLLSFAIVFTLLFIVSHAQTPQEQEPQTIAECLKAVRQYAGRQADAARKAGQKPDYRAYLSQAKELAKRYAARFKIEEVNEADLPTLAQLYLEADESVQARAAINRRLKTTNLGERERAEALLAAMGIMLKGSPSEEDIKLAEEYTAQIDAMSNSDQMLTVKIGAHNRMAGYYGYADMDEPNLTHNTAILKLIAQLPAEMRKPFAPQEAMATNAIALVQANRGETGKALETLKQGKAAATPQFQATFDQTIERYSLVGKSGAPLKGTHWLNAAPETKQLDLRGRVTLIQFTAHWCGPCRKSYPAMLKFHQQFKERGLDVLMATQLYGYFDKRQDLKPEEELAANREYYLEHHKLPFKIAVEPRLDFSDRAATEAARRETNEGKYFVGGIPQIVLLDKQGVVRQILIGWDPANETRVTKLIEQLLKEPAVAAK
jgi:thiol-disulfide isomerase/thioredoxin